MNNWYKCAKLSEDIKDLDLKNWGRIHGIVAHALNLDLSDPKDIDIFIKVSEILQKLTDKLNRFPRGYEIFSAIKQAIPELKQPSPKTSCKNGKCNIKYAKSTKYELKEEEFQKRYQDAINENNEEKIQGVVDEWQSFRAIPEEESDEWWNATEKMVDLSDSGIAKVYQEWLKNKNNPASSQSWEVFPSARIMRIYNDFVKYGHVRDESGLNKLGDLICENIFKLNANTIIMGHTPLDPISKIEDLSDQEIPQNIFDGFENYVTDPETGQWRISDYAMSPLMNDAYQIISAQNSTDRLLAIDRAINRIHMRGDIAKFFVEGGSSTLNKLAGRPKLPAIVKDKAGNIIPLKNRSREASFNYSKWKKSQING